MDRSNPSLRLPHLVWADFKPRSIKCFRHLRDTARPQSMCCTSLQTAIEALWKTAGLPLEPEGCELSVSGSKQNTRGMVFATGILKHGVYSLWTLRGADFSGVASLVPVFHTPDAVRRASRSNAQNSRKHEPRWKVSGLASYIYQRGTIEDLLASALRPLVDGTMGIFTGSCGLGGGSESGVASLDLRVDGLDLTPHVKLVVREAIHCLNTGVSEIK